MLRFVLKKLISKRWMTVSLLIGNILLIAIAAAGPMYAQSVLQRTLTRSLSQFMEEENEYPGVIQAEYSVDRDANKIKALTNLEAIQEKVEQMAEQMNPEPTEYITRRSMQMVTATYQNLIQGRPEKLSIELSSISDLEDHIRLSHGSLYSNQIVDNVVEAVVSTKTLINQELILGEELELTKVLDQEGNPYRLKIVGVFEMAEDQDLYWEESPNNWKNVYLLDQGVLDQMVMTETPQDRAIRTQWRIILDYTEIQEHSVEKLLQLTDQTSQKLEAIGMRKMQIRFDTVLRDFLTQSQKVWSTMWILLAPIFALLAAFIFMVSRQMLEMEQNEISVFKSRGASKPQILMIYLLQSAMVAGSSLILGVPLGWLICRIIGASNAFLEFVQRTAIPVQLDLRVWLIVAIAVAFSIGTMVLPVFRYANVGIVETKRAKNRKHKFTWWQIGCLDLVTLGIALYGLFQFRGQEEYLTQKVMDGAGLDPLLYICSSLFMIGAGLLCARVIPWVIRLIFTVGKRFWSPSLYASFMRILRTRDNQDFIVVFLILTVSLGIFSAETARTINVNAEDQLRYTIGADVVFQPVWPSDQEGGQQVYYEPDMDQYLVMDGVKHATKVLVDTEIRVVGSSENIENVSLMGIHTREFGQTAWFKDSLSTTHWYEYLNALSTNSRAILVSSQFRDTYGYQIGDLLTYTNGNGGSIWGVIYGFFDYWPSYCATSSVPSASGTYQRQHNLMIVANLNQVQASWGITPYQIWMDVEDSSQFLYDYAEQNHVYFSVFQDTSAELIKLKNDPVFQGTNGVLTVGFVVVLLLCATGFLIYWILLIQSRTLQFGIFRAMGMTMREILAMLLTEQFFISGISIAVGILVGKLCSSLYIPLIQIVYSAADQAIPLEIIRNAGDDLRLGVVIGLMMIICVIVLGVLISKIKISQALKLGED